jgi:hypothetical protein
MGLGRGWARLIEQRRERKRLLRQYRRRRGLTWQICRRCGSGSFLPARGDRLCSGCLSLQ